jgi:hypothetical protein
MPTWVIPAAALIMALSVIPYGRILYPRVLSNPDRHAGHSVNQLPVRNRLRIAGVGWAFIWLGFALIDASWLPPSLHIVPDVDISAAGLYMCIVGIASGLLALVSIRYEKPA